MPQVTQTKDEALRELKTLTGDKGWLDRATAGLADYGPCSTGTARSLSPGRGWGEGDSDYR